MEMQKASILWIDAKMANMQITEQEVFKLIDFGLALASDQSKTRQTGADDYYCPKMVFDIRFHTSTFDMWNPGIRIYKMLYRKCCFVSSFMMIYSLITQTILTIRKISNITFSQF